MKVGTRRIKKRKNWYLCARLLERTSQKWKAGTHTETRDQDNFHTESSFC